MSRHWITALAVIATLSASAARGEAQPRPAQTTQADALIGLARTARDQGRFAEAVRHFEAARRRRTFDTPLLVEFFWAAQRAEATLARPLGEQILKETPRDAAVRDGLIGVLSSAHDEAAVRAVAEAGAALEPRQAVWPRRMGESYLRSGNGAQAAEYFAKAAVAQGGGVSDRAMRALALESTPDKTSALAAWNDLGEAVWSTRPEWTASRARAVEALRPVAVATPRPVARPKRDHAPHVATPADLVKESRHALSASACATAPLATLEPLPDGEPFIDAIAARPSTCPDVATWAVRGAERAIGLGRFADALRIVQSATATGEAPLALREQLAVLLHWTGDDARAEPLLRAVVTEMPRGRSTDALIDVLRSQGRPDEAWPLALDRWGHAGASPDRRLAVASLALETRRIDEALTRARALTDVAEVATAARYVEASALLASGRPKEAMATLGGLVQDPGAALTWLDAVAATRGIAAALSAAAPVAHQTDRPWSDVIARRAVWHARVGEREASQRALAELGALDPAAATMANAEIALFTGRPADAVSHLLGLSTNPSFEWRAKDLLSTALIEQGQWDEGLATLAELRQHRPHDDGLALREAIWRDRRAPSAASLSTLEAAVADTSTSQGSIALARSYLRAGRHDRAWDVLQSLTDISVETRLLRAEIAAASWGTAAADAEFEELFQSGDADASWYLAWADLHKNSAETRRVLDRATQRFPADPLLQERLAVTAWAARDRAVALAAADAALEGDPRRAGAWFVKIAAGDGRASDTTDRVDRFERTFADSPATLLDMGNLLSSLARSPEDPAARRALGWATRIRTEQPTLAAAVVTQVRLLAALGERSRAMSEIDALVRRQPTLPEARKLQAELLIELGQHAQAVTAYDQYLVLAPSDLAARRLQARIDGWRGATQSSLTRYAALLQDAPNVPAIRAEAAAKRAYYRGQWREAIRHYDAWLAVEPDESEARLERAQSLDHLGETALAAQAYRGLSSDHRVAALAANRLDRRRAPSLDLFTVGTSSDGASRQQLLDVVDAGAGASTGIGDHVRVRMFGGASAASAGDRDWQGRHVGGELIAATASPFDVGGQVVYRKLDGVDAQITGDLALTWKVAPSLRFAVGAERSSLFENGATLESGLVGLGPLARIRWQPNAGFNLAVSARHLALTDDNTRDHTRADLSQRLWGRTHEVRLVASTEHLSYAQARDTYFTPGRFWRHDAGLEWRGWLATPQFYGDRERWISAGYLLGADDRHERYQTARVGVAYEFASGVGFVADGLVVRSRVYDGARLSFGLRLKHVPTPAR